MTNQIDTNKLKQAEVAFSIAKDMITSAIEQSAANNTLASSSIIKFHFSTIIYRWKDR